MPAATHKSDGHNHHDNHQRGTVRRTRYCGDTPYAGFYFQVLLRGFTPSFLLLATTPNGLSLSQRELHPRLELLKPLIRSF